MYNVKIVKSTWRREKWYRRRRARRRQRHEINGDINAAGG